ANSRLQTPETPEDLSPSEKDARTHPHGKPSALEPTERPQNGLASLRGRHLRRETRPSAAKLTRLSPIYPAIRVDPSLEGGTIRAPSTGAPKRSIAFHPHGAVAKRLGNGLQNRHTSVRIRSAPRICPSSCPTETLPEQRNVERSPRPELG